MKFTLSPESLDIERAVIRNLEGLWIEANRINKHIHTQTYLSKKLLQKKVLKSGNSFEYQELLG